MLGTINELRNSLFSSMNSVVNAARVRANVRRFEHSDVLRAFETSSTVIGRSEFAEVRLASLAFDGEQREVAIKKLLYDDKFDADTVTRLFVDEVYTFHVARHPHINHLFGYSSKAPEDLHNLFLVLQYQAGGSAEHVLLLEHSDRPLLSSWQQRLCVGAQVCMAIQHLHSLDPAVVHCDVRLANVLLSEEGDACLSSPGVMRRCAEGGVRIPPERLVYYAPEGLEGNFIDKSDVYALGCLLLELLGGRCVTDFGALEGNLATCLEALGPSEQIKETLFDSSSNCEWPMEECLALIALVKQCVSPRPEVRPTASQCLVVLVDLLDPEFKCRIKDGLIDDVTISIADSADNNNNNNNDNGDEDEANSSSTSTSTSTSNTTTTHNNNNNNNNNNQQDENYMCAVCSLDFRCTRFVPCGHAACCAACARPLVGATCPLCHAAVSRYIDAQPIEPVFRVVQQEEPATPDPDGIECIICLSENRDTRFHPCGHSICCHDCARRLVNSPCPLCRARVMGIRAAMSSEKTFVAPDGSIPPEWLLPMPSSTHSQAGLEVSVSNPPQTDDNAPVYDAEDKIMLACFIAGFFLFFPWFFGCCYMRSRGPRTRILAMISVMLASVGVVSAMCFFLASTFEPHEAYAPFAFSYSSSPCYAEPSCTACTSRSSCYWCPTSDSCTSATGRCSLRKYALPMQC